MGRQIALGTGHKTQKQRSEPSRHFLTDALRRSISRPVTRRGPIVTVAARLSLVTNGAQQAHRHTGYKLQHLPVRCQVAKTGERVKWAPT